MGSPRPATRTVPAYLPEALAASNVGTWHSVADLQRYVADEAAAAMFGLDPVETAAGIPLSRYACALHPADRTVFSDRVDRVTENGGLFVMEYRTTPREGVVRWVLARGRYERDPATGEMAGRGILIDITESKLDGHVEDCALFVAPQVHHHPLDRAADLALEAREVIEAIDGRDGPILRQAVDALLWAVGRALARRTDGGCN